MQHLNLYDQLERYREPPFAARQVVLVAAALLLIYLLVFVGLSVSRGQLDREFIALSSQQQAVQSEVEKLQAQREAALADESIKQQIAVLERREQFLGQVLQGFVGGEAGASREGFSAHLKGLAAQSLSGLWLTRIGLQRGGSELSLQGKTVEPAQLPRYIQKLGEETIFAGQQFRVFRMHLPQHANGELEFEVRSREVNQ